MSPIEFAGIMALGLVGVCCVLFLLLLLTASVVRREVDEYRFRREMREAWRREDERAAVERLENVYRLPTRERMR